MEIGTIHFDELPESAKQVTYAEDQAEYRPLPCVRLPSGEIATRWILDEKEREVVFDNGEFYLVISTFNHPLQPLMPMVDCPDIAKDENGRLFFYSPLEHRREQSIPEKAIHIDGLPEGYRDALYTHTNIEFGFWDRIKILFGWKVNLNCKTFVEKRPGKCYSESEIFVYRERKLPKGWGVAVAATEEADGKNL